MLPVVTVSCCRIYRCWHYLVHSNQLMPSGYPAGRHLALHLHRLIFYGSCRPYRALPPYKSPVIKTNVFIKRGVLISVVSRRITYG
ncbi:hypothetical protein Dd586_1565 [Dickeya parazeae Ech586]|uniref:Uncharacterized protein n=1 Tax=Dickeya zeae (strain Ech586) TaxID=590409 RepID=D2BX47_DICZ5|nr:hypothetical protein Dd586_1565 [Dickeya parazeae Ech586]